MNEPSSRDGPRRLALRVDAVDVLPTDLESFLVRVAGSWEAGAERPEARPELVMEVEGEERRFPALTETSGAAERAAREADAFRAAFSVPEALGPDLAGPLRLAIGGAAIELPEARLPRGPAEAAPGATVIDRAVLAERRARRAEVAEEATAQRAQDAEQALRGLESELAKLELRLERAVAERSALAAEAAERERTARAATQREYAERRRREESSEEAAARVQEAERAARELRARLRDAETRAASLAREAEALRRRAAEAEHAVVTADAARARAERAAAELGDWVESVESLTDRLAAAEAAATAPERPEPPAAVPPPAAPLDVLRTETALARRVISEPSAGDRRGEPFADQGRPEPSASPSAPDRRGPTAGPPEGPGGPPGREPAPLGAEAGGKHLERALGAVVEAERRLREAGVAINRTAGQLRAERDAQQELAAALERERTARVDAEQAATREREAREAAESRAAALQQRLDAAAAAQPEQPDLREFVTTAAEALRQAEGRIGEAQRAAAALSGRIDELEGQLLVERAGRERAEAALGAHRPTEAEAAPKEPSGGEEEAAPVEPSPVEAQPSQAEPVAAQEEPVPAAPSPAEAEGAPVEPSAAEPSASWLPAALERLLEREPAPAVALLLDLVAGQALNVERALDYRLSVPGQGVWSVSLRPGRGVVARMDPDSEPVGWGHFELTAAPRPLLDVLVDGGSRRVRRRVKVGRTLRRRRALRSLPPAELRPGRLAAAEIWLDPLLLLRALAELVDPMWTAGHEFVVAHQVEGPRGRPLWVQVADRAPLAVLDTAPEEPPAVTIHSAQGAFQRFLGGEPPGAEKSAIRGDAKAVAAYTGWLERARSAHGARSGSRPRG